MYSGTKLSRALAGVKPVSFTGELSRRVGLAALLTPLTAGGAVQDMEFLYATRRRNRFTPANGPASIYFGEDEDVGSAETKRVAFLGSFAKTSADPAVVFWAKAKFPATVLDLTDKSILRALGTTDTEVYDPDWKSHVPRSPSELLGSAAFRSGRFAAIKYWSVRMRLEGKSGICYCIFKSRVAGSCTVQFEVPSLGLTEVWP